MQSNYMPIATSAIFDLLLEVIPSADTVNGFSASLTYNADILTQATAQRMADHLHELLHR